MGVFLVDVRLGNDVLAENHDDAEAPVTQEGLFRDAARRGPAMRVAYSVIRRALMVVVLVLGCARGERSELPVRPATESTKPIWAPPPTSGTAGPPPLPDDLVVPTPAPLEPPLFSENVTDDRAAQKLFEPAKKTEAAWERSGMALDCPTIEGEQRAVYACSRNRILRWEGTAWDTLYAGEPLDLFIALAVRGDVIHAAMNNGVALVSTTGTLVARHRLGKRVSQVMPSAMPTFWAVSPRNGLWYYDGKRFTFEHVPDLIDGRVLAMDDRQRLVLKARGLWRAPEKSVIARMTRTLEQHHPEVRHFASARAACDALLDGKTQSGDIGCVRREQHTYLFFGKGLVAVDDYATGNTAAANQGWNVPAARNDAGTVAMLERQDGKLLLHVSRAGAWTTTPLDAAVPGSVIPEIVVDREHATWLCSEADNQLVRVVGGASTKMPLPIASGTCCSLFPAYGSVGVQQGHRPGDCGQYFERVGQTWKPSTSDRMLKSHFVSTKEGEWTWACCSDHAFALYGPTGTSALALSWHDRLAVPYPTQFAADALGNLWIADTGGGVAVHPRSYLRSGRRAR